MNDYPVRVRIDYPERSSRGWAILTIIWIKALALIPHGIVLLVLGIGAAIVFVIAQIAVVARGVFPPGMFLFLTGYVRWYTRVKTFFFSLTDRYPPFTLESDADYPVDVEVDYPDHSSRLLAGLSLAFVVVGIIGLAYFFNWAIDQAPTDTNLDTNSWYYNFFSWSSNSGENPLAAFRIILLIPHLIVVAILGIAAFIVWFIVQWVILFAARFPEGMHKFVAQWTGWGVRIAVYSNGLTDRYPPFTLETVESGPSAGAVAGLPPAPPPPPPPGPYTPTPTAPPPTSSPQGPPAVGSGGAWIDDRFAAPPAGEERTTQLPPPAPPQPDSRPQPQPPESASQQPPAAPTGEGRTTPLPPTGAEQAAPETPTQGTGEPTAERPAAGPSQPPAPPEPPTPPRPPY